MIVSNLDVESARADCDTLKCCFGVAVVGLLIYTLSTCWWAAALKSENGGTTLLSLPRGPIWNPPPVPTYQDFLKSFPSLEGISAPPWQPTVYIELPRTAFQMVFWLWPINVLTAIVYSSLWRRSRDLLLDAVWWAAVVTTCCVGFSLTLWLAFGGWGPPLVGLFAMAGVIVGPVIACLRQPWSGRAAELLAEKRRGVE